MIKIELGEKEYEIPHKWEEVKFSKFLEFYKLTKTFKTQEELEEEVKDKGEIKDLYLSLDNLKANTKMVSFWTGLTEDEVAMCDIEQVAKALKDLTFLHENYKPIHIESFLFEGEKYYLPKISLEKMTFGEYIKAEQLELNAKKLENGKIEVLPEQVAILCKKEGESVVSDEDVEKRAELFKNLDMATIWDVAFFLTRHESLLMTSFLISQREQGTLLEK